MEEQKPVFRTNGEKLGIALFALENSFLAVASEFGIDRKSVKEWIGKLIKSSC